MSTHYVCQNSMTGAIHALIIDAHHPPSKIIYNGRAALTPCGYYIETNEFYKKIDFKNKAKVCIKCHNSLKKSHDKDLMARVTYLKLKGAINDRFKI